MSVGAPSVCFCCKQQLFIDAGNEVFLGSYSVIQPLRRLPGLITPTPHIAWIQFYLLSFKVQLDVFLLPPASLLQCVHTSTAA